MSFGLGTAGARENKKAAAGAPFPLSAAYNGSSVDIVTGQIVLGQDVGAVGDPAALISDREIPMNGFGFVMIDDNILGNKFFRVDSFNSLYQLGDISGSNNGSSISINDNSRSVTLGDIAGIFQGTTLEVNDNNKQLSFFNVAGNFYLDINYATLIFQMGDINGSNTGTALILNDTIQLSRITSASGNRLFLDAANGLYQMGDIGGFGNSVFLNIDDTAQKTTLNKEFQISDYGIGTYVGTPTFNLQVDTNGNIIEGPVYNGARNGLKTVSGFVELGDSVAPGAILLHDSFINSSTFLLNITGSKAGQVLVIQNDDAFGSAIFGAAAGGFGTGVSGTSGNGTGGSFGATLGTGLSAQATEGVAGEFVINAASLNTIRTIANYTRLTSGGVAATGIGLAIRLLLEASDGNGYIANQIISELTNATAATVTSKFSIRGFNAGVVTGELLSVSGNGALKVTGDTTLIHTGTALANGAAAAAGSLLNAPAAGDPTKWIPIDDNGTTRYIPAW